jgi:two-component system, LytTR family, sensor kinase
MRWPTPWVIVRAYLVSFALWCGVALLMGLQYRTPDQNHFWHWLAQFLSEAVLRAVNLGFWTPPVFYLVNRYLRLSKRRVHYWLAWSLGAFPFVLLHSTFLWILVPHYDDATQTYLPRSFQSWWDTIRHGFADQILVYILIVVAAHAYEYLKRLRSGERDRYEYQQALAASELQTLKMQLHPHFLFNTLVGVSTLVDVDAEKAKSMILKLSSLLRTVLDGGSYDLIPLESELKFVREYLDLEKMRFGNRLETLWAISPEASRFLVPQMILQPLVENAIRHGIAPAREGGWVEIEASARDGVLGIHVRNSIVGNGPRGTGLGLRNVESRLKHLYFGKANLHLNMAEDHIATASLVLPALECRPAGFETAFEGKNEGSLCGS